jgi:hypothetical protein
MTYSALKNFMIEQIHITQEKINEAQEKINEAS